MVGIRLGICVLFVATRMLWGPDNSAANWCRGDVQLRSAADNTGPTRGSGV